MNSASPSGWRSSTASKASRCRSPRGSFIRAPTSSTNTGARPSSERRLDFQYYEHDLARLPEVVLATYRFVKEFEKDTGYAPNGWATYFVNRPEKAKKPFGLYSDGPGVSFSFDPFSSNPAEPRWQRFAARVQQARDSQARRPGVADPDAMAQARRRDDPAQARAAAVHDEILRAVSGLELARR